MNLNQQLLQINRNFLICFIVSAIASAGIAQMLGGVDNHLKTSITVTVGYIIYFAIFSCLFYFDNKKRYDMMDRGRIKKEIISMVSSFGIGEIIYLGIRWPSLYYFLEMDIQPFLASIISEVIATGCYMATVTIFLRKTKTF